MVYSVRLNIGYESIAALPRYKQIRNFQTVEPITQTQSIRVTFNYWMHLSQLCILRNQTPDLKK